MRSAGKPPPRVSVIMPVHNGERWLAEAAQSILRQSERRLELIVIDDGSTDQTRCLLAQLSAGDARVRLIQQNHLGLVVALNRGIAAARAPLIARLDADDIAYATRLERQAGLLDACPGIGLVGSWAMEIDAHGRPRRLRRPPSCSEDLKRLLLRTNPFVHSTIMARSDLLRDLGGYRCVFQGAEDYDLWLRAAERAEVANIPEALVGYRVHASSVSQREGLRQAFSVRIARKAAMARLAGKDPADPLPGPPEWRCPSAGHEFYAEAALLYRWLDADASRRLDARAAAPELIDWIPDLSHAERKLAARAMLTRIRSRDSAEAAQARRLLMRLCLRRPRTVLRAAWSLRA